MDAISPVANATQYPNPSLEIDQYLATNLLSSEQSAQGASTGITVNLTSSSPSYSGTTISTNDPTLYGDYVLSTIIPPFPSTSPTTTGTGTVGITNGALSPSGQTSGVSNGAFFNGYA